MTTTHDTVETTVDGSPVRRFECPACPFVMELAPGTVPFYEDRGDSTVGHVGAWQLDQPLVVRG